VYRVFIVMVHMFHTFFVGVGWCSHVSGELEGVTLPLMALAMMWVPFDLHILDNINTHMYIHMLLMVSRCLGGASASALSMMHWSCLHH